MTQTEWSTAVHESAHAVVARALGLQSGPVTIVPDFEQESAGDCTIEDPWHAVDRWTNEGRWWREYKSAFTARLMANMAATEAENVLLGYESGGDGGDRCEIACHIGDQFADPDPADARLRQATRHMVRRYAPTIERVARALLKRKTLTSADLDTLIALRARVPREDELEYVARFGRN